MSKTNQKKQPVAPSTCVVYERVSTEEQSNSGLGLKSQRDMCRNYAKSNGLRIKKYYTDKGISGTKGVDQRPQLSKMLQELTPGTIVLVAKRDRISRDTFLSLWVEKECKKVHAVIESASGEGNGDSPADEMMRRIVDAFSEYERNLISQRTKNALAKSTKKLGRVPYGYKKDSSGRVVKNKETYPTLERIQKMREGGQGWSSICHELNEEGIPSQRGGKWQPTVVMRLCNRMEEARMREAINTEQEETEAMLEEYEKD